MLTICSAIVDFSWSIVLLVLNSFPAVFSDTRLLWYLASSNRYWITGLNYNRLHTRLCAHGVYVELALIMPWSQSYFWKQKLCEKLLKKKSFSASYEDFIDAHKKLDMSGNCFPGVPEPFCVRKFPSFSV